MPGFASVDQIINALSANGKGQYVQFQKLGQSGTGAAIANSLWTSTGLPEAGTHPTLGLAGAVVLTKTSTGALKGWINPTSPATLHVLGCSAIAIAGSGGELIVVDRIAHAQIANAQATGNFSPNIDATSRLAAGEGAQIYCEVSSALSAAANSRTFTYTNQDGTAGRVTPSWSSVASAGTTRTPYANFVYVPLAAGDFGVRSIQSTNLVSGSATGQFDVCLVKPIFRMPLAGVAVPVQRDYVIEFPQLPRIYDDACLQFIFLPISAATQMVAGEIVLAEN